jgi:hypothetical protein
MMISIARFRSNRPSIRLSIIVSRVNANYSFIRFGAPSSGEYTIRVNILIAFRRSIRNIRNKKRERKRARVCGKAEITIALIGIIIGGKVIAEDNRQPRSLVADLSIAMKR